MRLKRVQSHLRYRFALSLDTPDATASTVSHYVRLTGSVDSINELFRAPDSNEHGFLDQRGPYAGDLPNIHVPVTGNVSVEYLVDSVTLQGGKPASLLDADGAALVMHAGADDYQTNPAGGAGERLVCGVIMR